MSLSLLICLEIVKKGFCDVMWLTTESMSRILNVTGLSLEYLPTSGNISLAAVIQ